MIETDEGSHGSEEDGELSANRNPVRDLVPNEKEGRRRETKVMKNPLTRAKEARKGRERERNMGRKIDLNGASSLK